MNRIILNSVVAAAVLATWGSGNVVGRPQAAPQNPRGVEKNDLRIRIQAELSGDDGVHLAATVWEPSDGEGWTVTVTHHEFPTPIAAEEYLDKQVAKVLKVIKRGNAKWKGKIDGRRIEVMVRGTGGNDSEQESPAVLRADGPQFYEILSDSFVHISRLENPPKR